MILHKGDMWKLPADLYVVTTNATKRVGEGSLVMGRGAARQALDWWLQKGNKTPLDLLAGRKINHMERYGFRQVTRNFGIFQVKMHWSDVAHPELIRHSADCLKNYADANPDRKIVLNYPGIGNGKLGAEEVAPLIEHLPDNVVVCYQGALFRRDG